MIRIGIGEQLKVKDLNKRFFADNYKIKEIGIYNFKNCNNTAELDFYKYIIYKKENNRVRVDFDFLSINFNDFLENLIIIRNVDFKKERKRGFNK